MNRRGFINRVMFGILAVLGFRGLPGVASAQPAKRLVRETMKAPQMIPESLRYFRRYGGFILYGGSESSFQLTAAGLPSDLIPYDWEIDEEEFQKKLMECRIVQGWDGTPIELIPSGICIQNHIYDPMNTSVKVYGSHREI